MRHMIPDESIPKVIKKILPAVVSITASKYLNIEDQSSHFLGFEELLLPPRAKKEIRVGGGSGFIVDPDGLILTNSHVLSDPKAEYVVILDDEKRVRAEILARDPLNDIAILKIKGKNLPILPLGDSSNLELGQTAIAIGNALGTFRNTVSVGVVSGLSREIDGGELSTGRQIRMRKLIQTDAAINPGNSGGPLINLEGEAIGINTAVVFLAENVGFAIPINPAKKDLEDVKKYGKIRVPFLGVKYIPITKDLQEKYNLPADYGALLVPMGLEKPIIPKGPADKAGLKEEDIILQVEDQKLSLKEPLEDILQKFQIGQEIELTVLRKGKEIKLKTVLGERN